MPTLDPPFRAEIIGSFLRPPAIKQARADHRAGKLSAEALREIEDEAIRGIVALQTELGLQVATDGEFRRGTYSDSFTTSGIAGVTVDHVAGGDWTYSDGKGGTRPGRVPVVHDRIRWAGPRNAKDFAFLKSVAKEATPKITLPGPGYIHYRAGRTKISRELYPSLDGFWADLTAAYHAEIRSLYEAGCRYLQLDETSIAKLGDPKIQGALAARGDDWRELLNAYTDAINAVLDGVPSGMRVGMHLCRGNQEGHWQAAGGYDPVAEHLFRKARVGFYFLEYDSPRAGSFAPLAAVPEDKVVVLGLVSTKIAELESADSIKARVAEAAKVVPLDRLCLSPQCGFASSEAGNPLSPADQRAKLSRVVEVAREIWR